MSAFTPGPWRFECRSDATDDMGGFYTPDGQVVCHFGDATRYYPSEGSPPSDHDARLIAAAPQMYDLLQRYVRSMMSPVRDAEAEELLALIDNG